MSAQRTRLRHLRLPREWGLLGNSRSGRLRERSRVNDDLAEDGRSTGVCLGTLAGGLELATLKSQPASGPVPSLNTTELTLFRVRQGLPDGDVVRIMHRGKSPESIRGPLPFESATNISRG
jgi:hypothetical protein